MSEDVNEQNNKAHANGHHGGEAAAHLRWDELLAAYTADELGAAERLDFDRHLADCAACRSALADTRHIRTLLRTLDAPAPATDSGPFPSLASPVLARLAVVARDDGKDEGAARPVSASDSVPYPDSLQWRSIVAPRHTHPALTWHSGVRGLERWRMSMERDTRDAGENDVGEGGASETSAARAATDDALPTQHFPDFPSLGRRSASRAGHVVATIAAVLLVAVLGSILFANRPHGTGRSPAAAKGTAASTATVAGADNVYTGGLSSISMVSATDGWAVGATQIGDPNPTGNVLLHYTSGRWTRAAVPTHASLYGVAMVSATEGWAVGNGGVILHYFADVWSAVKSPTTTNLYSISMASATEGWAVGAGEFGGNAVIVHCHNGAWSQQELPALPSTDVSLYGVTMVSAHEGWAVGDERGPDSAGLILRYDGARWALDARITGAQLHGISMISSTDGWAVGSESSGATLLMRYTGSQWQRVAAPSDVGNGHLDSVSMASADEGWAVGGADGGNIYDINGAFTVTNVILLHYHHGHWTSIIPPNVPGAEQTTITSVAMVSASEGWAAGQVIASLGSQRVEIAPLLFHYADGAWSVAN